ncbi:DMT family transporter [Poseidonocella sedimentorum]|uniref:Transporter family-2 protein n=1 Tax=Poseidonocella sedimentorum TaxID=871652 RepID=A0A1I6CRW5_9RHOB|nr:DMT family transporter [Poseidonocella sedimentorum]SFQ95994.1 transporter family-2 protein [Poseidonocella sedimentorum]
MHAALHMLAAVLVGALLSLQPSMNAMLARAVGSAYGASAISIGVAFASILLVVAVIGAGRVTVGTLTAVPWWIYLAGVVGTIFVASGVVIAPVTGALVFFVCIVTGQMLGSLIADHVGAFGLAVREINSMRVFGITLVCLGAIIVTRW